MCVYVYVVGIGWFWQHLCIRLAARVHTQLCTLQAHLLLCCLVANSPLFGRQVRLCVGALYVSTVSLLAEQSTAGVAQGAVGACVGCGASDELERQAGWHMKTA